MRGELVQQPWFLSIRRDNADAFVYVSLGVNCLLGFLLSNTPTGGTMAGQIAFDLVWYAIGFALLYLYIALGTKLAHRMILVSCVGGALISLIGAYSFYEILSLADQANRLLGGLLGAKVVPTGLVTVLLVSYLVMSVVYAWCGVLFYRGMKRVAR